MSVKLLSIPKWGNTMGIEPVAHWWKPPRICIIVNITNWLSSVTIPQCILIKSEAQLVTRFLSPSSGCQRGYGRVTATDLLFNSLMCRRVQLFFRHLCSQREPKGDLRNCHFKEIHPLKKQWTLTALNGRWEDISFTVKPGKKHAAPIEPVTSYLLLKVLNIFHYLSFDLSIH